MIYGAVTSNIAEYLNQLGNPWKEVQSLDILIPNLISLALIVAVIIFFSLLLLGGIQWITSGGDKESLTKAQGKITSALIGIVIVFSAWAILNMVKYFFGLSTFFGSPAAGQFDCCSIVGGQMRNTTECCKLVDSYGCVFGRYQPNAGECGKLRIDWNCWAQKFAGGGNPDPNNYCKSD